MGSGQPSREQLGLYLGRRRSTRAAHVSGGEPSSFTSSIERASLPAQSASQRVYFVGRFRSGTTSGRSCIRTGAEQRRLASVLSPKAARYRPPQSTPFNRSASQIAPAPPEGETGAIWGASASKKIRARLPPLTPAWRTALVKARSPRHPLAQSAHEQLVGALAPRASAADRA